MNNRLCNELARLGAELRSYEAIDPHSDEAYDLRDRIADIEDEMNAEAESTYYPED